MRASSPSAQAAKAWMAARMREGQYTPRRPLRAALATLSLLAASAVFVIWLGGFAGSAMASTGRAMESQLTSAGFVLRHVDIHGTARADEAAIARQLLVEPGELIFHLDPDEARRRVNDVRWVRSASVMRLLPDRVVVMVDERAPLALWRADTQADDVVIDDRGAPIDGVSSRGFEHFITVVGNGAPEATSALLDALGDHPAIAERAALFVRMGRRRWDIEMRSGMRVKLPEGSSADAIALLAELDARERLLDLPLELLDIRSGDVIMRQRQPRRSERGA